MLLLELWFLYEGSEHCLLAFYIRGMVVPHNAGSLMEVTCYNLHMNSHLQDFGVSENSEHASEAS